MNAEKNKSRKTASRLSVGAADAVRLSEDPVEDDILFHNGARS